VCDGVAILSDEVCRGRCLHPQTKASFMRIICMLSVPADQRIAQAAGEAFHDTARIKSSVQYILACMPVSCVVGHGVYQQNWNVMRGSGVLHCVQRVKNGVRAGRALLHAMFFFFLSLAFCHRSWIDALALLVHLEIRWPTPTKLRRLSFTRS